MRQFALSPLTGWTLETLGWASSFEEALLNSGELYSRVIHHDDFDPKTFDPYDTDGLYTDASGKVGVLLLLLSRTVTTDFEEGVVSTTYERSFLFIHERKIVGVEDERVHEAMQHFQEGKVLEEKIRFTVYENAALSDFTPVTR